MIVIIAGGRSYRFQPADFAWLSTFQNITLVITGASPGADAEGERWASHLRIPIRRFPAEWVLKGHAAGPIRNKQMITALLTYQQPRAVLLFPGGRGTASMKQIAKDAGVPVYEYPSKVPS